MTQANVLPSDRVALEPCPFCGASAEHDSRHYSGMKHPNGLMICGHAVYCSNAGCIGQPAFSLVWPDDEGGLPEAIAAWNTRHRIDSTREMAEAYFALLERAAPFVPIHTKLRGEIDEALLAEYNRRRSATLQGTDR